MVVDLSITAPTRPPARAGALIVLFEAVQEVMVRVPEPEFRPMSAPASWYSLVLAMSQMAEESDTSQPLNVSALVVWPTRTPAA